MINIDIRQRQNIIVRVQTQRSRLRETDVTYNGEEREQIFRVKSVHITHILRERENITCK